MRSVSRPPSLWPIVPAPSAPITVPTNRWLPSGPSPVDSDRRGAPAHRSRPQLQQCRSRTADRPGRRQRGLIRLTFGRIISVLSKSQTIYRVMRQASKTGAPALAAQLCLAFKRAGASRLLRPAICRAARPKCGIVVCRLRSRRGPFRFQYRRNRRPQALPGCRPLPTATGLQGHKPARRFAEAIRSAGRSARSEFDHLRHQLGGFRRPCSGSHLHRLLSAAIALKCALRVMESMWRAGSEKKWLMPTP